MVKKKNEARIMQLEEFFSNTNLSLDIQDKEEKPRFSKKFKGLIALILCSVMLGVLITLPAIAGGAAVAQVSEPVVDMWKNYPEQLDNVSIAERNIISDKNGDVFAQIWSEDRVSVENLDDISDYAKEGLIATEDKRFYDHKGIDVKGTARAALRGGGGSGITQQLVKNLQFYNMAGKDKKDEAVEVSYERKVKELKLSLSYEEDHSKDEILLEYFNTVAFGSPNIYSIEAASQYFFGKSAKKISLAESAVLVGSVQNPAKYDLNKKENKDDWKSRQKIVLDRMVAEKYITQEEAEKASDEKLKLVKEKTSAGSCASSKFPFYCDYVMTYLKHSPKLGETQEERDAILAKGGLHIKTYMDPKVMKSIDERLENDFGNKNRVVAPAAVVEPGTGGVTGFGVNREYGSGEGKTTINVPANKSGTGSAYKPITIAAALENGMNESSLKFSSACPLNPGPNFDSPSGGFKNSNGCTFQTGNLDYEQATAWSSNTWFVTLAMKTGMKNVLDMSKSLNLNVPDSVSERSLSFVLGSAENSNINMAAAFGTFANEGIFCPATPVESYEYADGTSPAVPDTYDPAETACRRVTSPHTASVVLKAMRANTYPGHAKSPFGTDAKIKGYDAVGKSGTNQNYNWTWVQVSKEYSMFFNIYDMDRLTRGVSGMTYKGRYTSKNISTKAGSDVLRSVVDATNAKSEKLDYNNKDSSLKPVPVETRDFFTIPSALGMSPGEAVSTMESLGIKVHVSKEKRPSSKGYPKGVIIEQSLKPGLQLPVGTNKEIILYESE